MILDRVDLAGDRVSLYYGDAEDVLLSLPAGSVDALICDPPYSSGGMIRGDRMLSTRTKYQQSDVDVEHPEFTGDNRDQRGFLAWSSLWLRLALRVAKPGAVAAIFVDWRQLPTLTDALQAGGWVWRGIMPWDKVNSRPMPNRFRSQCEYVVWGTNGPRRFDLDGATYHPGILTALPVPKSQRVHAAQKPQEIIEELCRIAPPGGVVCDLFGGSATTALAALATGRRAIVVENNATVYAVARERIAQAVELGLFADPVERLEPGDLFQVVEEGTAA